MKLLIQKTNQLKGTIEAPPSKSYTHRFTISASLADGKSVIRNPLLSDDTLATINACQAIGSLVEMREENWTIEGTSNVKTPDDIVNCHDSGSTARFMLPVTALAPGISVFTGNSSLRRRPMEPLLDALRQLGVRCYSTRGNGRLPIVVFGGGITGGGVSMVGDVSSQFVTGLLFACPMGINDTEINLTTPLESKPYVRMTLDVLARCGIKVETSNNMRQYKIPSKQSYMTLKATVPGDYSSAAFMLAAAAITQSKVRVTNLDKETIQSDKEIVDIFLRMGVHVEVGENFVEIDGGELKGIELDATDIPDLVPPCVVVACYANGKTRIRQAKRLRLKESDRLNALSTELSKMGAKLIELEDGLIVKGPCNLQGAEIDPHSDHRIAMACAVAALGARGLTQIRNPDCIRKSYPSFINDLQALGGNVSVG